MARPPYHRPKSVHSRGSGGMDVVKKRHPEFPLDESVRIEPIAFPEILAGPPEDNLLSLDRPCIPAADSRCYLLDNFNRLLTAGTYSPSSDGGEWSLGGRFAAYQNDSQPFSYNPSSLETDVWSSLGTVAIPWTERPPGFPACGIFDFVFAGWMEKETWIEYTIPEHPSDFAGFTLGPLKFFAPVGLAGGTVGQVEGAVLRVSPVQPTTMRAGTVVASLPHNVAVTPFIPASLVPAAGEKIWIGVSANWTANLGDYTCGFRWPWMDGKGNSAKAYIQSYTDALTWQSWDAEADSWGTAMSDDANGGSWWEGNLPWVVTPSTAGLYGYDGNSLYLTVGPGSVETLTAKMWGASKAILPDPDAEDGDFPPVGEPWTHALGVAMKAKFRVTGIGAAPAGQHRYLEFSWADGRDLLSGQVRIGDSVHPQGVLVADGETSEFKGKAIEDGDWMWIKVDSRNPDMLKAKVWKELEAIGSGEGPIYDVAVFRNDDAELPFDDDFFQIFLSAGNSSGPDMTIEVSEVWFCGPGDDCEWVEEHIGQGDGETAIYETSQPAKTGALWFFVDGFHVPVTILDKARGQFLGGSGFAASLYANLVARYLVDRNPEGD